MTPWLMMFTCSRSVWAAGGDDPHFWHNRYVEVIQRVEATLGREVSAHHVEDRVEEPHRTIWAVARDEDAGVMLLEITLTEAMMLKLAWIDPDYPMYALHQFSEVTRDTLLKN